MQAKAVVVWSIAPSPNRNKGAVARHASYTLPGNDRALLWQTEILVPPHRNPIRKNITQLLVDDQTCIALAMDRVLWVRCLEELRSVSDAIDSPRCASSGKSRLKATAWPALRVAASSRLVIYGRSVVAL